MKKEETQSHSDQMIDRMNAECEQQGNVKFHNCTAKEFRIDGTYTIEEDGEEINYDFTITYFGWENANTVPYVPHSGKRLEWREGNEPDDTDAEVIKDFILEQFNRERPELLKQAELTLTEHEQQPTFTPEQYETIAAAWKNCYGEDIREQYHGFWKMIQGKGQLKLEQHAHNYEEWLEKYTVRENHLDDNASFDGCAFKTYGAELEFVESIKSVNPKVVWTVVDADGGLFVIAGFHFVNRVNYFITEQEWTADEEQKEYFIS